ncbi:MAG: hypothetical protein LH606_06985 [Cytophagaceae bacterium]|nr:hypothetical protein [Cytophagaceae bacterium]
MKPRFLFPHRYKRIGWLIAVPALILGILCLLNGMNEFALPFLVFEVPSELVPFKEPIFVEGKKWIQLNLTDELAVVGLVVGMLLAAFSKERMEDEWVGKIRLESLQWALYVNSILLVLATLLVYDGAYLNVMIFNMFTPLVIFLARFNYILYIKPRLEQNREGRAAA